MTTVGVLDQLAGRARRRRALILAALAYPWILAAGALAWRIGGVDAAGAAAIVSVLAVTVFALRSTRHFDATWAARRLDDHRSDLEDSTRLLLLPPAQLNAVQRLQRVRVENRIAAAPLPDLRPSWPTRPLMLSWMLGLAVSAAALLVSPPPGEAGKPLARPAGASTAGNPRLVESRLEIEPPTYTALPARSEVTLDARLPAGSNVRWHLRFDSQPTSAQLVFHDQRRLQLVAASGAWTAEGTIDRSTLYRIVLDGGRPLDANRRYRLDVVADQPPSIAVIAPAQNVTLHEPGQQQWLLQFEASDDYGLGAARLHVTRTQGGGENVTVTEREVPIVGVGDRKHRRYAHGIDLASWGLAKGDDLIVRLTVEDNRRPAPNSARSASLILRWPPGSGEEPTGVEGIVRNALPAYFRSQRQVIIDTEALVAERPRLTAARFMDRSDKVGIDQRLLRLRYGQFLGEEAEDIEHPPGDDHDGREAKPVDSAIDGADSVVEQFGHMHDIPEAATLLDPETRELLRGALREMWQAELHLRQGQPARALPYEYRALERIKQVQQATRIYLARVGLELPPIDDSRRLTGDASGVRSRGDALNVSASDGALPAALWEQLGDASSGASSADAVPKPADLASLSAWVRAREARVPQAIELLAAIDDLAADPLCGTCRQQLRALLWPLLPQPAAGTRMRVTPTASGKAYLDALESGARP